MKASELRIGNLVFDNEGILSKINGFQPYGHSIRCDELEGCELLIDLHPQDGTIRKGFVTDINSCKPIPLTEEWLINFGMEYTDGFSSSRRLYFNNHEYDLSQLTYNEKEGLLRFSNGHPKGTSLIPHIKYVHQLQNLYFALTGEELTIKD